MIVRWLILVGLCLVISALGWLLIEHQLTLWGWYVCPDGWWRSSPGFCAFPLVSISILSAGYGLVSILLLATVAMLAPAHKLKACMLLLIGLALWPVYTLIFKKLSWVALASLACLIAIAACFALGAFVMHTRHD